MRKIVLTAALALASVAAVYLYVDNLVGAATSIVSVSFIS